MRSRPYAYTVTGHRKLIWLECELRSIGSDTLFFRRSWSAHKPWHMKNTHLNVSFFQRKMASLWFESMLLLWTDFPAARRINTSGAVHRRMFAICNMPSTVWLCAWMSEAKCPRKRVWWRVLRRFTYNDIFVCILDSDASPCEPLDMWMKAFRKSSGLDHAPHPRGATLADRRFITGAQYSGLVSSKGLQIAQDKEPWNAFYFLVSSNRISEEYANLFGEWEQVSLCSGQCRFVWLLFARNIVFDEISIKINTPTITMLESRHADRVVRLFHFPSLISMQTTHCSWSQLLYARMRQKLSDRNAIHIHIYFETWPMGMQMYSVILFRFDYMNSILDTWCIERNNAMRALHPTLRICNTLSHMCYVRFTHQNWALGVFW